MMMVRFKNKKWLISICGLCLVITSSWLINSSLAAPVKKTTFPRKNVDAELLARVIRAEAEAEPYTGKVAVGAVILNRIQSAKFPNTLSGVIYQPHAFESVSNGQVNRPPTADCQKAARSAIGGWDPSGGAIFFFNPAKVGRRSYVWSRQIIQRIGKHVFAL